MGGMGGRLESKRKRTAGTAISYCCVIAQLSNIRWQAFQAPMSVDLLGWLCFDLQWQGNYTPCFNSASFLGYLYSMCLLFFRDKLATQEMLFAWQWQKCRGTSLTVQAHSAYVLYANLSWSKPVTWPTLTSMEWENVLFP